MKNNQVHKFIDNINVPSPEMPKFQQTLRRAVLNQPQPSPHTALFSLHSKKSIGFTSLALLAVFVLSIGIYSFRYSPKAVAEQLVDQSLDTLLAAAPPEFAQLQERFGGDPAKALQEAKQAKDLRVITKAEYRDESQNAPGVFSTSLSSEPNAPSTNSISVSDANGKAMYGRATASAGTANSAGGEAGFTAVGSANATTSMPAGGAVGSGTLSTSGGPSSIPPSGPNVLSPTAPDGSGTAVYSNHPMLVNPNASSNSSGPTETRAVPISGNVGIKDDNVTTLSAKATGGKPPTAADLKALKIEEPSKYLRYTNKDGRVVILSLNDKGMPIFKTVFMTSSEAQKIIPRPPQS
ncbi:hypothetical protein KW803_01560 [Candidatus Saccharibacteria bacterium]|nr:hypothetical protein [Candidatus Saccharibacteria bacterium]